MSVRRARQGDHPRITEIRTSVKENVLRDPGRVTIGDYVWFRDNPGIWVWEENGDILGFTVADTRDGSIWALFVDPAHQRRGIGRSLFEKALKVLREDGHRTAWLTTQAGSRAEGFYVAAGWKVIGTSPRGEAILHGVL